MVVDLKRFKPRQGCEPGLLWVVEQVPGLVVAQDMTEVLARGYWPSYNVAFFPEISEAAGYPSFAAEQRARGVEYDSPSRWLMYQVRLSVLSGVCLCFESVCVCGGGGGGRGEGHQ
jgi:hypothetical protein